MPTPEETRDRIKAMRDRIFNEPDKEPIENDIKETPKDNDLAEKEPDLVQVSDDLSRENDLKNISQQDELAEKEAKVVRENEASLSYIKKINALEESFSEKLQQNDNKLSLLSTDMQKQLSEIALDFASKSDNLETTILSKLENNFAEGNSKIYGIESLINESIVNLSNTNKALKNDLDELNRSIQLDLSSFVERFSSENQKIETDLENSAEKLTMFENLVAERQNSLEQSFSEKLRQNEDKISILGADTQKQLSEIAVDFASKSENLETTILNKIDDTSSENNSKFISVEHLINESTLSSSQENKSLKERLEELNRSFQLEISSITERFSSENRKVENDLKNSADKLIAFEKTVDERQNSLEENFYEKLQQNGDRISLLSSETQRQISEIIREFTNKSNNLEAAILDKFESTFTESNSKIDGVEQLVNDSILSSSQENKALKERLDELNRSLQLDISSVAERFASETQKIEAELKKIADRITIFENSVDERQNFLEESFLEKLQHIAKRFSSANQKIETELKNSADKFTAFENSVYERQNSLEGSFLEKLQQNDDKISLLSADTQKKMSELALDLENKNNNTETSMLDRYEHISFHLKKVEEQIENQMGDLSKSIQKFVLSITDSQDQKIDNINHEVKGQHEKLRSDFGEIKALVLEQKTILEDTMSTYKLEAAKEIAAQTQNIQKSIKLLKQEIFEHQRDIKTDFEKNIKARELKTNDYFSKRVIEVRESLSEEVKSLSGQVISLKDELKNKHSELAKNIENNRSTISKTAEKDREYINNRFEKVSDSIQSVESMIVKEEDLTELFQNYTLNVNISDDVKPSKR